MVDAIIEFLKYLALGIVQGITEIFPVSSSGHLTIFAHLFKMDLTNFTVLLMITNMGSFLALLLFFRKDVIVLISSFFRFITNKEYRSDTVTKENVHYLIKLLIAVIPIGIVGFIISKYDLLPDNLLAVGIALIFTGCALFIIFLLRNIVFNQEVTYKRALIIGLVQTVAVFPGISRSGTTTMAALGTKVELKKALRFSFLSYLIVSVPVSLLGIIDAINAPEPIHLLGYSAAFVMSFIFSFLTVKVLYKFVKVNNFIYFSIYCLLVGIFAIILNFL